MHLINVRKLELEYYPYEQDRPPYAILSHTWDGDHEVTYQEFGSPTGTSKRGWRKIEKTCRLSLDAGLNYAWVDTCCINKESSAELSEAINSMYKWYQNARLCFVYLHDLSPEPNPEGRLSSCKWWTRGWTLQELLAPSEVWFLNREWTYIGPRKSLLSVLSDISRVPGSVLTGETKLIDIPIAQRMSWAAGRNTSRLEDEAYCLLGIFDVNLPLLYGEGEKAFHRLQEEIIKRSNDLTIFAHTGAEIIAKRPADFDASHSISPYTFDRLDFMTTNQGLRFNGDVPLRFGSVRKAEGYLAIYMYVLQLGYDTANMEHVGICLRKIGPSIFQRTADIPLARTKTTFTQTAFFFVPTLDIMHIHGQATSALYEAYRLRTVGIYSIPELRPVVVSPEALWNRSSNIILKYRPYAFDRSRIAVGIMYEVDATQRIGVLCNFLGLDKPEKPLVFMFDKTRTHRLANFVFGARSLDTFIYWGDLHGQFPMEMQAMGQKMVFNLNNVLHQIHAEMVPSRDPARQGWELDLNFRKLTQAEVQAQYHAGPQNATTPPSSAHVSPTLPYRR